MHNGVDIIGSDVTLLNNQFKNILCPSLNCFNGIRAAIRAYSGANPTHLVVGSNATNKCILENCFSGIAAYNNVALDVQYNEFNNSTYSGSIRSVGISGIRSTGMTQTISYNNFKYFSLGINLRDANKEVINIQGNIFNNFPTVITNYNLRAITVASTIENSFGSIKIKNNFIKHHQRGILVINQIKAEVLSNIISLDNVWPQGFYGIRVQNSGLGCANSIIGNSISRLGVSSSTIETTALGISVETGTSNTVKENIVSGFGTGIRFYNNMSSNSVLCNSLFENYEGITMESSNIGNQGTASFASDNIWTRGTNTDAHLFAKGTSGPSFWYVQTSGSYYPNNSNDIIPPGYYTLRPSIASTCTPPCINQYVFKKF